MNTTKLELCNRVSKRLKNKAPGDLKTIFETFLDEILEVLSENKKIEIRGFGCFKSKLRKKKTGRNPRTGEEIPIPEYTAPTFKFSRDAQKIFDVKLTKTAESRKASVRKNRVKKTEEPAVEPHKEEQLIDTFTPA